tara:strand:- start:5622 stop:6671 length:1050 start_codon:yes stop_codon:yes gene_type:complete
MGGLALKNTFTRRYSREEFDSVSKELIDIIEMSFDRATVPLFFYKKETFGDIDIIIDISNGEDSVFDNESIRRFIESKLTPNEIFHNGNAFSFDYKEVQVDFICVPSKDFDANYHYLAFNDLGNFIGRLAQSIGFKYGQEGLWVNYYSDANTKTKIMVSKDYPKIFDFLGLDYQKWVEGFDTLEEIFDYAMSSSLFNPEMFQLKELNKINRERNIKRKSYMSFLEYIKDKSAHPEYNKNLVSLTKESVINIIREGFPEANIDLRLAEIEYASARKKLVNTKFNGRIIMEKYGLEGKELGEVIKNFKDYISEIYEFGDCFGYTFDDFIIDSTIDYIYKSFEQANDIKMLE